MHEIFQRQKGYFLQRESIDIIALSKVGEWWTYLTLLLLLITNSRIFYYHLNLTLSLIFNIFFTFCSFQSRLSFYHLHLSDLGRHKPYPTLTQSIDLIFSICHFLHSPPVGHNNHLKNAEPRVSTLNPTSE